MRLSARRRREPAPWSSRSLREPRVLLVTGASSGIGRATCLGASAAGHHVVLLARGESPLNAVAKECRERGAASAMVLPADVGDDRAVADAVRLALRAHARLDGVVGCAGVAAFGRTEDIPVAVFDAVVRTNLAGTVNLARHTLPALRAQGRGSLVLVGSVTGHIAVPNLTPYVASKWAVRALARQLQLENRDRPGVRVSYVAPGVVRTPIWDRAANYSGRAVRTAPPTISAERVAAVVLHRLARPRKRSQVGPANLAARAAFSGLPGAYDALVGPVYRHAVEDPSRPVAPTTGNVLSRAGAEVGHAV